MRRALITAMLISVLLAGCGGNPNTPTPTTDLGTPESTSEQVPWDDSPFESEQVVVAINDTTNSSNNFTYAASAALRYWNEHIEDYGKYNAHFDLQPNATNPDVVLRQAEQIDCPESEWSGCAPIPNESTVFSDIDNQHVENGTVIVRIEDDSFANWRIDRNNVIHEIGHVLGLGHYNQPLWVMTLAGRGIAQPVQDVQEAPLPWRDTTLSVYVNTTALSDEQRSQVMNSTHSVLSYYNSGAEGYRPHQLNLQLVDSAYKADIVIQAGTTTTSGVNRWGRSVDQDEALEYFVRGEIYVHSADIDRSYDIVGRMMAYLTRPNAVPPEFDHLQVS